MLDKANHLGRLFMSRGWIVGLLLIALTIGFGAQGFLATRWERGDELSLSDALYKAISLLAIQTGATPTTGIWRLELARWLGMLFWSSALLTLAIRLFRESFHRLLVRVFARDHVIIAGLGQFGARLVEMLRATGRTVVVIEADRNHPAVDQCRRIGALLLFGEPDDTATLLAANLPRAVAILALFREEPECVRTATTVYDLLHSEKASVRKPPVCCVLRLIEPGLLDVVRRHRIKTDPTDRIQLEILNSHEIAATTMVREATVSSVEGKLRKAMLLGLGAHHRLGEMVTLRLAKDHRLVNHRQVCDKLEIHVYDEQAEEWLDTFRRKHPLLEQLCAITAISCSSRKIGPADIGRDYDAAFVCIPDEGYATAQAVMLRRDVLPGGEPIMVRVKHSGSGYGGLLGDPGSGWGENIHAVGQEDALYDPDIATQPEMELRAQTIHHEFRMQKRREILATSDAGERAKVKKLRTDQPWHLLEAADREQNRELAKRYDEYLKMINGSKTNSYRREFMAGRFGQVQMPTLFVLPEVEVEALAELEHNRWLILRQTEGWIYGEVRDDPRLISPYIRRYDELTQEQKRHNRDFVRNIPRLLALADYAIVADKSEGCDNVAAQA